MAASRVASSPNPAIVRGAFVIEFICDWGIKTANSAWCGRGLLRLPREATNANDRSSLTRVGRNVLDQHLCRCRCMVRELPAGRFKLWLRHARAMLGHGARPWGILPAESIPRDGLRDLRRELESPRHAKAVSARLLSLTYNCQGSLSWDTSLRKDKIPLRNLTVQDHQAKGLVLFDCNVAAFGIARLP
jgi:hypothetical protein